MEIKKVNYQDDFDFILHLIDANGKEIGIPDYNWVAKFYTTSQSEFFFASYRNGVYMNCFEDNGKLHIVCNNHGLKCGVLQCKFIAEIPNDIYADNFKRLTLPKPLNIEIVRGPATFPRDYEVELLLTYIKGEKGDPFTFADFTEEQLNDLQKPLDDAAAAISQDSENFLKKSKADLDSFTDDAEKRIDKAISNTNVTITNATSATQSANSAARLAMNAAENADAAAGNANQTAENIAAVENAISQNETNRLLQEQERKTAETQRELNETQRGIKLTELENNLTIFTETTNSALSGKQDNLANSKDVILTKNNTLSVTELAKRQHFIDMWNKRGDYNSRPKGSQYYKEFLVVAKYDVENAPDKDHPFYINKLWLSYEEAIEVMNIGDCYGWDESSNQPSIRRNAKTLFPLRGDVSVSVRCYASFSTYEVINIMDYYHVVNLVNPNVRIINIRDTSRFLHNSPNIREVLWKLNITSDFMNTHFYNTTIPTALEIMWLGGIKYSFVFKAPKFKLECWEYMIDNAANTTAITITVHPDVYAKLIGSDDADYGEDNADQWHALLTSAAAKNISFATA